MKSRFTSNSGTEALFNEVDSDFSGTGTHSASLNPGLMNDTTTSVTTGTGIATATLKFLHHSQRWLSVLRSQL